MSDASPAGASYVFLTVEGQLLGTSQAIAKSYLIRTVSLRHVRANEQTFLGVAKDLKTRALPLLHHLLDEDVVGDERRRALLLEDDEEGGDVDNPALHLVADNLDVVADVVVLDEQ